MNLAPSSHTSLTAAADLRWVARRAPSSPLDVVLTTPARSSSPRAAPHRVLGGLATDRYENWGLDSIAVRVSALTMTLLLGACASTQGYAPNASTAAAETVASKPAKLLTDERALPSCAENEPKRDCDRRAILAMAGEFEVSFNFEETVQLAPGYARKPDQHSGAREWVVVVQDDEAGIVLQHVLQVGAAVVKHWRQDWRYEQPLHWEYRGLGEFAGKQREATLVPGTWTQYAYDVNDAPRYAGSGRWNHRYGVSTWTSDRTWRPLPRRDYSKRSDYQLINAENRHTITPNGWTHEQDNTKTQRAAGSRDRTLVREFGFNEYRRVSGADFGKAKDYWRNTADFWAAVRSRWSAELADHQLQLVYAEADDESRSELLKLADRVNGGETDGLGELDAHFARLVKPAPGRLATTAQ